MLLAENREVYLPAVDDHGVDLIARTLPNQGGKTEFQEIQVKSVSTGGLFAAIKCDNPRDNYWFVFNIKDIDKMWLINSHDFVKLSSRNSKGENIGKFTLDLKPANRTPIKQSQYLITNFSKLP